LHDALHLHIKPLQKNVRIIILNLMGKEMKKIENPDAQQQIAVGDLVSGTYFIRLENDKQILTKKFCVVR